MKETVLQNQKFIDDLIHIENEDGKLCKNTFEIALQAIIGEAVLVEYKNRNYIGLIPRIFDINFLSHKPDKYAIKAIQYLESTCIKSDNNSLTWLNDYEVYFRGKKVLDNGWICSFGQSYILLAFVWWYKNTKDKKYLELAIKTAKFYTVDIANGGFKNNIIVNGNKRIFFEELPSSSPTHILNAFLISFVALNELKNIYSDDWLNDLVNEVDISLSELLPIYDTGNWSRYDIPNDLNTTFQIGLENIDEVFIDKVVLNYKENQICIDHNIDFDTNKDIYLSGIEWGMIEEIEGSSCRKLINGKKIRNTPISGGMIQNSYINIHIDDIQDMFIDDEIIKLDFVLYSKKSSLFYLNIQDCSEDNFAFKEEFEVKLNKGWNIFSKHIPIRKFSNILSDTYHSFHIDLLNILRKQTDNKIYEKYFYKFLSYKQDKDFRNSYLPYIEDFTKDKKLEVAFISVNSVCGLNCIMCDIGIKDTESSLYKHLKSDTKYNMTIEDFEKITDNLINKVKAIAFIGTEALFNKNIHSFINIAKNKGFNVSLTTNGLNLLDNVDRLVDTNLDELWLSIDGIKDYHDNIRGHKGLFDKFEQAIKELSDKKVYKKSNLKIFISSTILPSVNDTNLLEFIQYFEKYKIDGFSLNHMNFVTDDIAKIHNEAFPDLPITASKYIQNFDFKDVDYLKFYNEIHSVKTYASQNNITVSFVPELTTFQSLVDYYLFPTLKIGKKTCTAPWSTLEIDPKSNMSIAARCFQIDMGNIIKENFDDIWMGKNYINFRNKLLENESFLPCHRCCGAL